MKTYLDCIPCFFKQALRAARIANIDDFKTKKLLDEIGLLINKMPLGSTPPEFGRIIYGKIRELTGNPDPYKNLKQKNIKETLRLYPNIKEKIYKSVDPLMTAVKAAIAGNVIDIAINPDCDIEKELNKTLKQQFAINDYEQFKYNIQKADKILYIGDNAGESVFDRILIEEIKKPTFYVVREIPVINDVTYQDAIDSGLNKVSTILSSGTDAPGLVLNTCSNEFLKIYENADFIISKGQGNYEALSDEKKNIFFLLKAKCPVIARDLKIGVGDIVLKGTNM
jgi:hypothetical protein